MGKKSKSKYWKARARLIRVGEEKYSLREAWEAMMEWLEGVPWEYMSREGRINFEENAVKPAFEAVGDYFFSVIKSHARRVRPSYIKVWEYIVDQFKEMNFEWVIDTWEASPQQLYRIIADQLGLSWRTVRDAVWAAREYIFG